MPWVPDKSQNVIYHVFAFSCHLTVYTTIRQVDMHCAALALADNAFRETILYSSVASLRMVGTPWDLHRAQQDAFCKQLQHLDG